MTSWTDGKWYVKTWTKTAQITTSSLIIFHPSLDLEKTKFRDIAKTDWQIYQDELTKHMTNTADVFNNLITSTDIDKAACQLAANVRSAFNSACTENYASNKVRSPPWETPEVREAKARIKHRLRQA